MMRALLCVIVIFAGSAQAQAPTPSPTPSPAPAPASSLSISGPSTIPANSLATLAVTGGATPITVAWDVEPTPSIFTTGTTLVFAGPPTDYRVTALIVSGGTPTILHTTVTIQKPETLAIAVFDPSALTSLPTGQVAIYQSSTIAGSLAAQGVTWLQYSITDVIPSKTGSSPFGGTTWGKAALRAGLPALVSSVNGVVTAVPLPADEATIVGTFVGRKR